MAGVGGAPLPAGHAAVLAAVGGVGDAGADRIAQLAQQQRDLLEDRRRVSSELRNETKKRKRLMEQAKKLSTADLVAVLGARQNAQANPKAKAKGKAKAKAAAAAVAAGAAAAAAAGPAAGAVPAAGGAGGAGPN